MREPSELHRQRPPATSTPAAQRPVPGSRAAAMEASAAALRAAAGDMEDPRTSPLAMTAGADHRRAIEVASWLRRRATIMEPPPPTAWERNKAVVLDMRRPELEPAVRAAAVEAFGQVAAALVRFDIDAVAFAPQLLDQLADLFSERAQVPA